MWSILLGKSKKCEIISVTYKKKNSEAIKEEIVMGNKECPYKDDPRA